MRFSIFLVCLLGAFSTQAQQSPYVPKSLCNYNSHGWSIISKQIAKQNANAVSKTTSSLRLKQHVTYTEDVMTDSFVYKWGGSRTLSDYTNSADIIREMSGEVWIPSSFELSGRYSRIQADTIIDYHRSDTGAHVFTINSYGYDVNDRLIERRQYDSVHILSLSNFYYEIFYNSSGKVTSIIRYGDTSVAQNGAYTQAGGMLFCFYDANGLLIKDSSTATNSAGVYYSLNYYQKDAQGRDTGSTYYRKSPLVPTLSIDSRNHYEYNNNGFLTKTVLTAFVNGDEFLYKIDSFGYIAGQPYPAYYLQDNYIAGMPLGSYEYTYSFSSGVVSQERLHTYEASSGKIDSAISNYYIGATGNVDSIVHSGHPPYDFDIWNPRYFVQHFEYEPTSISQLSMPVINMGLYPNPAKGMIYLSIPSFKPNTRGTASIYDMQGRLVMTSGIIKNEQAIDVSHLPAGMYLVQYSDGDGSLGVARFVKE